VLPNVEQRSAEVEAVLAGMLKRWSVLEAVVVTVLDVDWEQLDEAG